MLIAIWNTIQIPYGIAFNPNEDSSPLNIVVNLSFDILFMLDIVISFRTSYIDEESGEEIASTKKIASQYLKGRFMVDLVSSLPTDIILLLFHPKKTIKTLLIMLKLLKLIRLARLSRVITYLNLQSNIKMTLRLVKLIFFLILYLHFIA